MLQESPGNCYTQGARYLVQRPSGFYLRVAVPEDLRLFLGVRELTRALNSRNRREAIRRCRRIGLGLRALFDDARLMSKDKNSPLTPATFRAWVLDFLRSELDRFDTQVPSMRLSEREGWETAAEAEIDALLGIEHDERRPTEESDALAEAVLAGTINEMDNDPQPRWYAEARYAELAATVNPGNDPALRERWIEDNSCEWITYREMWSMPEGPEGKAYWAQRFGDVFIVSLDANRVWRTWAANQRGKFTERFVDAQRRVTANTDEWGFGDINFRPFGRGSRQHDWLQQVLASEACRTARLRIVLSHQTMAGLGDNAVPVQAEIRTTIELTDGSTIGPFPARDWPARWPAIRALVAAGEVRYVKHDYLRVADQWLTDIEPLLLAARVHLVHTGHSHLWNRTRATGADGHRMHYLEASNFGNSFGAMFFANAQAGVSASQGPRNGGSVPGSANWVAQTTAPQATLGGQPRTGLSWNAADYPVAGEVHARPMAQPSLVNPMRTLDRRSAAWTGQDLPFVASNNLCTFSVLDTATATVTSWCFDSRDPASAPVRFDELALLA